MSNKIRALEITFPQIFAQTSKNLKFQVDHIELYITNSIEAYLVYFRMEYFIP